MNEVRVTVLMPAFNASPYISEAIRSVLDQTYSAFELLIVNDGSTDNTAELIRQFADPRIRVLEQTNQGIVAALNRGLREARGSFIARFDADDICFPQRLQQQVNFLDSFPEYILTGCDAEYISESGEHLFHFSCVGHTHEEIMAQLLIHCPFIHSGVMYHKDAVIKAGGYCEDAHNFEDYFLWVKMAGQGRYHNIPEELIKVRFNPGSVTIDEKWRGRTFRELKKGILQRAEITKEEGQQLSTIIRGQDLRKLKESAYYALCGKKFLVNNHQPSKARANLGKAIRLYPLRLDNYALYMISFFPGRFVQWLHKTIGKKS